MICPKVSYIFFSSLVFISFAVMLVGCSPEKNHAANFKHNNVNSDTASELRGSRWLDQENTIENAGFKLNVSKSSSGIDTDVDIRAVDKGGETTVEVVNLSDSFTGLACRVSPPTPYHIPVRAEWSDSIDNHTDSLKLTAIFNNSIDVGVFLPGLIKFSDVNKFDVIIKVVFVLSNTPTEPRYINRAPKGAANSVSQLDISIRLDGTAQVSWNEKNLGDYDNDGEVGVPDITPIAQYFGVTTGEIVTKVDGSGDGEIGVPDITTIAENYGASLIGYNVYRIEEINGTFSPTLRLPNNDTLASLASVDRPNPSDGEYSVKYEYVDRFPPTDKRYVYGVRPFDGVFEEGSRSFPGATYTFYRESVENWQEEQTVSTSFGHSVLVPAGGLPDNTIVTIRVLKKTEINEVPSPGSELITGVEVKAVDESGNPVSFISDMTLTIPIPLGIASISTGSSSSAAKHTSGVNAPDLLPVYKYNLSSHILNEYANGNLTEDSTAYSLTISDAGVYCLFGAVIFDYNPPVWQGSPGAQSIQIVGDNLIDVYFGSATDDSTPVTYNVYLSTSTPIDFDTAEAVLDFETSPARIDKVRGAADYYIAVRAQDRSGNEDENVVEKHMFVPRPNDSIFLTTDKDVYELGETIFLTANVKAIKGKLYQLNAVRVTFTPLVAPAAGSVTLGSFFDYHDGVFFPAPIIPVEGNPSFLEFNVSFAQATKEAPAGSSGDLFEFKFKAYKKGNLKFNFAKDPAPPFNPYHFYTSAASKEPQRFSWHQGCSVKIVEPATVPVTTSS